MEPAVPSPASTPAAFDSAAARRQLRTLRDGVLIGLLSQILIWASVFALLVVGSLYTSVPSQTTIAYGANGISISAGEIIPLNFFLLVGALVGVYSLILCERGFRNLSKTAPHLKGTGVSALALTGAIGFGLFSLGWLIWLGSFVPPGINAPAVPGFYSPVLAPSLSATVGFMLVVGGLLAFLGMIGAALGSSAVGTDLQEPTVELGGVLSALPVLSIIGNSLFVLGLQRIERKLAEGWVPAPPPPPYVPFYPVMAYPTGGAVGPYYAPPNQQGSWDGLAVVLVVILVLVWLIIIPFAFVISAGGIVHGPSGNGGGAAAGPEASSQSTSILPFLVAGIVVTGFLLPIAVVRNKRKRERAARPPQPPTLPPPPPPTTTAIDPLDHLT